MATSDAFQNQGPGQPDPAGLPARRSPTRQEIEQWFVNYLAHQLDLPADRIDVTIPFDDFALDSATAIVMSGDLEEWLGRSVDPTLIYDYPTIAELAEHLAQENPASDADVGPERQ